MPAVAERVVLEREDVPRVLAAARAAGPYTFALLAWMYEFGARAAEPGLQRVADVDLYSKRAKPMHLKSGRAKEWFALLPFTREAMPLWLDVRPAAVQVREQGPYLFPSERPGKCETCNGTGKRPILRREGHRRFKDGTLPCHHCDSTGKRWGVSRFEVYATVKGVMKDAGIPDGRSHPHVLRHSIVTHLLDSGVPPASIQKIVGHKNVETTLSYAQATQAAARAIETAMLDIYKGAGK